MTYSKLIYSISVIAVQKEYAKIDQMITVVQSIDFQKVAFDYFPKQEYLDELITFLALNPNSGNVVEGTKGIRKLRWKSKINNSGKSGGYRIFFSYEHSKHEVWILTIIAKTEIPNISKKQRNDLKRRKC